MRLAYADGSLQWTVHQPEMAVYPKLNGTQLSSATMQTVYCLMAFYLITSELRNNAQSIFSCCLT